MPVYHSKKHDINDEQNHIKNDLDINGNFTLLSGNEINFARDTSYSPNSYIKWDNSNIRFLVGHTVEIDGSLLLAGEATIVGGPLSNDSLTIRGSRVSPYPRLDIEGNETLSFILEYGSGQKFIIQDSSLTTSTYMRITEGADVEFPTGNLIANGAMSSSGLYMPSDSLLSFNTTNDTAYIYHDSIDSKLYIVNDTAAGDIYAYADGNITFDGGAATSRVDSLLPIQTNSNEIFGTTAETEWLKWNTTTSRWEFEGNLKAPSERIGTDTDYSEFGTDGSLTFAGTARKWKQIDTYGYNMYGVSGTYNGVVCSGAGSTLLNGVWYMKSFDQTTEEAAIVTLKVPIDYEDGTDIKIVFHWTTGATTGDVAFGVGILPVGVGDDYTGTVTYLTGTDTAPTVAYTMKEVELTFTGTGIQAGDDVSIVFYRDAANAADTIAADALVSTISLKYISNKMGADA